MAVALVALFVFIGASRLLSSATSLLLRVISEGLSIAGWVALWLPLELLTFTLWQHRLDKKTYSVLMDIELDIQPSAGDVALRA